MMKHTIGLRNLHSTAALQLASAAAAMLQQRKPGIAVNRKAHAGFHATPIKSGVPKTTKAQVKAAKRERQAQRLASPAVRLEYLRSQLRAECISYGELHELQCLAEHIDAGDVELLEAAGVPEHPRKVEEYAPQKRLRELGGN